jgi:hypothetical protein
VTPSRVLPARFDSVSSIPSGVGGARREALPCADGGRDGVTNDARRLTGAGTDALAGPVILHLRVSCAFCGAEMDEGTLVAHQMQSFEERAVAPNGCFLAPVEVFDPWA